MRLPEINVNKVMGLFVGLIAAMIAGIVFVSSFSGCTADFGGFELPSLDLPSIDLPFFGSNDDSPDLANALLDASGVKQRAADMLDSKVADVAAATGIPESDVQAAVDGLAIEDWQLADLPEGAQSAGSYSGTYAGQDATIVTYDDPSYVTIQADGQELTFQVPESAQSELWYLDYL